MNKKVVFTGESYGLKITYQFNTDIHVDEAFNSMMNILIGMTYSHEQIKSCIINLAEEYKKEEEIN